VLDYPLLVLVVTFLGLWITGHVTASYVRRHKLDDEVHEDYDFVLQATLTLLGLVIGFNLLIGVNRYDQRKLYEEAEANAIGTEYLRADLLPPADATKVRSLLKSYLDQRILFYTTRDEATLRQINARTAQLQNGLWGAVVAPAAAQPNPVMALAVSGMNDVLNSQGYTQFAWWNRIPFGAWCLMAVIAVCCNVMVGYGLRKAERSGLLMLILPFVVSISFFLIADIDSPRRGVIQVEPENLKAVAGSLSAVVPAAR
jgi:hypothetical protein